MAERPLNVWVLSDGQPGHYNQARGIVRALRRIRPVEVSWINAKLRLGVARNLLRSALNRNQAPRSLWPLRLAYRPIQRLPVGLRIVFLGGDEMRAFSHAPLRPPPTRMRGSSTASRMSEISMPTSVSALTNKRMKPDR